MRDPGDTPRDTPHDGIIGRVLGWLGSLSVAAFVVVGPLLAIRTIVAALIRWLSH